MTCPKCGFEQAEGVECVRCGVIFSRFRGPSRSPASPPAAAAGFAPPPPAAASSPETVPSVPTPSGAVPEEDEAPRGPRPQTLFDPNRVIVDKRAVHAPDPVFGSELLREAVSIFGANLLPFCLLAGLALTPSFVVGFLASSQNEGGAAGSQTGFVLIVSFLFCQPLATGAVTFGVFNQMRHRDVSLGDCLGVGISSLGRVVMVGIVQTLWFGLLLFLSGLPSLFILFLGGATQAPKTGVVVSSLLAVVLMGYRLFATMVKLSVSIPSAIEEKLGPIAALKRSAELTDGSRWPIFRALFFIGALNLALQLGTVLLLEKVLHLPEARELTATLVSVVTTALGATASAVIYYRLRGFEESVDVDQIASVFG